MAINNNGFGFQTKNVTDTDTNTNIANTDLTQDDNRTLTGDGNDLIFTGQAVVEVNCPLEVKNGTDAPNLNLHEASGSGTNYVTLTCGALASNKTITFPDATGTVALTSDIVANTNLGNADLTADAARSYNVNGETLTFKDDASTIIEMQVDEITFGSGTTSLANVNFKFGTNPPDIRIFEDSSGGTDSIKLTCGALSASRTLTMPDATGTITLLESDQTFTGKQNIEKREFKLPTGGSGDVDGDVLYIGTGSVQAGKVYYFDGTDWAASDADAVSTSTGLLGIALGTGATATVGVLVRGFGTLGATTGGSNGDVVYVDTNASRLISTAPSGSGDVVRVAGYLIDSTNNIVWFNPDGSWVEIA